MLYTTGLEEVIYSKHEILSDKPDELIIISGYLGPAPLQRLSELKNIKVTVIAGMYQNGIDARLLNSLENINNSNKSLTIKFSNLEVHSKIYIWKKHGKTLSALIGSANFSSNGLRTDYRESLADATRDTFNPLDKYFQFILDHSSESVSVKKKQDVIDFNVIANVPKVNHEKIKYSVDIPLYDAHNEVPTASGLNWGLARLAINKAHTSVGDAYIRLPKDILQTNQALVKPYNSDFVQTSGKKRNSDPIELIWDDGNVMEASLEGSQTFNGLNYPKQLSSYSSKTPFLNGEKISKKSILGRYLRKRMNIGVDDLITMNTLKSYGRSTITLSLIEEGVYYADFSVE